MKLIIAALAVCFAGAVNALTLQYDYVGDPWTCPSCLAAQGYQTTPLVGSITIDHSLAPDLRGQTLRLFYDESDQYNATETWTVAAASKTSSVPHNPVVSGLSGVSFAWVPWLTLAGEFDQWFWNSIYQSDLNFTFDQNLNITCWTGYAYYGGSEDPGSTCGYDVISNVKTTGAGTWTVSDVTPVPLPGSGLLLLGALLGLTGYRRSMAL